VQIKRHSVEAVQAVSHNFPMNIKKNGNKKKTIAVMNPKNPLSVKRINKPTKQAITNMNPPDDTLHAIHGMGVMLYYATKS
jgi:hypothetical protein